MRRFHTPRFVSMMKVFGEFQPTSGNCNFNHPEFEEACIPLHLNRLNLPIAALSGLVLPDQRMANGISGLLAKGRSCSPAYTPYAYLPINREHWNPPLYEHKKETGARPSRIPTPKSAQLLSSHVWALYRIRFISQPRYAFLGPLSLGYSPILTIWERF